VCGIVAIINKDSTAPEFDVLKKMADKINYRGPDNEGHFIDNQV
jgi:asparagine synthase (glutamine-hydrolysing)